MSWEIEIFHVLRDIKEELERHDKIVEKQLKEINDRDKEIYIDEFGNECDMEE